MIEPLTQRLGPRTAVAGSSTTAEVLRRAVPLRLVVELEDVLVRIGEAVGRAVADVAVDPTRAEPGLLDGGDPTLERSGLHGAQCDVARYLRAAPR